MLANEQKLIRELEELVQYCQNQWGIFTRKHFEQQYSGQHCDAAYKSWLRDVKKSLSPILEKYLTDSKSP